MLVGIHKNHFKGYTSYMRRFETILDYNNIEHIRIEVSDLDFWEKVAGLDLFIYWWGHEYNEKQIAMTIIPIIEKEMGITCLPDMQTCGTFDDKIKQDYLLRCHGFPIIPSWIFWDKRKALNWLKTAKLPVIFKLKGGAGSSNVILVKSKSSSRRLIRKMFGLGVKSGRLSRGSTRWKDFNLKNKIRHWAGLVIRRIRASNTAPGWELHKNYVLFQKFLPNNDYDTRVTVIGNRAFAYRRLNRANDFRSSGSGRIDHDINKIDMKFVAKAFEVSKVMGFQSMAYDFLYDENGDIAFCEISYTYVDYLVYECHGYWDSSLNWHEGHFWPQYCQLVDTLKLPELQQPDMQ